MAALPTTDFDLGPLSWVKTEIDHSLNQARENLDKLAANPADRAPVRYILTHLHQATGALAMVGLGAATRFNEELEKLVAFIEGEDAARLPETVVAAKRAIAALSAYLDTLLAATGFFDALVFDGLQVGPTTKPLFAKLDLQIKQLIDGTAKVAERVFRDLLLAIGRARPVTDRIEALKEAYRLEQLIHLPDAVR